MTDTQQAAEREYLKTAQGDLATAIGRLDPDFPNYASWSVELPAGHWRAILAALSTPSGEPEVVKEAKELLAAQNWGERNGMPPQSCSITIRKWCEDVLAAYAGKPDVAELDAIIELYHDCIDIMQDGPDDSDMAMAEGRLAEAEKRRKVLRASQPPRPAQPEGVREALQTADAWLDRWATHVGDCSGDDLSCTCGLARVRWETAQALAALQRQAETQP